MTINLNFRINYDSDFRNFTLFRYINKDHPPSDEESTHAEPSKNASSVGQSRDDILLAAGAIQIHRISVEDHHIHDGRLRLNCVDGRGSGHICGCRINLSRGFFPVAKISILGNTLDVENGMFAARCGIPFYCTANIPDFGEK